MLYFANPIYDTVFKYWLEDERVVKILLSALLKKTVVEVEMRKHEYANVYRDKISMFRIDFAAKVREEDGHTHLVLIELQKNVARNRNAPLPSIPGRTICQPG